MKLINLFTLIVLCVSQMHSMNVPESVNPFELFPDAKPVVLIIKDIDPEVCKQQFDAFHEAKNLERKKTEEYKIVEYYAESLFRSSQSTACCSPLYEIQDWISRSVNRPARCGAQSGRILCISMEDVAKLFSSRAGRAIAVSDIEQAKPGFDQWQRFKTFSELVLKISGYEIEKLSPWIMNAGEESLNLGLGLACVKARRNIHQEFGSFCQEYLGQQERINLKDDFDEFTQGRVDTRDTCELVYGFPVFPKSHDFSVLLAEPYRCFIEQLCRDSKGDCYRSYKNFIIKSLYVDRNSSRADLSNTAIAEACKITIQDRTIYQEAEILHTDDTIWALTPLGELRIYPQTKASMLGALQCHGNLYPDGGPGQPVACVGHMEVRNGKISKINRGSGHYQPSAPQLIFAIKYLNELGVISPDIMIEDVNAGAYSTHHRILTLQEVLSIADIIDLA